MKEYNEAKNIYNFFLRLPQLAIAKIRKYEEFDLFTLNN